MTTDQKIVALIQQGKQDKAFLKLYTHFPKVKKLILSKGGTKEDAQDIYQEALIIFYRKASNSEFQLTSAIGTYLYSVARFLWKDASLKSKSRKSVALTSELVDDEINETIKEESRFRLAEKAISRLGKKCQDLLQLFYIKKRSMKEIATLMDFASDKGAKNQKYKCLLQARQELSTWS